MESNRTIPEPPKPPKVRTTFEPTITDGILYILGFIFFGIICFCLFNLT